jgi:hypothetical protein
VIEQDHRHIKSRTNVMFGFKRFRGAATTISGIGEAGNGPPGAGTKNRRHWISTMSSGVDGSASSADQESGLMQKREFTRKRVGEAGLTELMDRLELALTGPARTSVCRALVDHHTRLDPIGQKEGVSGSRSASPLYRRHNGVESLSLFT